MRTYRLWTTTGREPPRQLEIQAESLAHAAELMHARGLLVLDPSMRGIRAHDGTVNAPAAAGPFTRWRRADAYSSDLFAEQLLALLRAGIGPVESVRAMAAQTRGSAHLVLQRVLQSLEQGRGMARALDEAQAFNPLMISLVAAAEETSDLSGAMERYLQHAQQVNQLRQRLITTSVYPALLLAVGTAVMIFLLLYVIPRFSGIFESIHTELPWSARALMSWGALLKNHGAALAVAAGALLFGFIVLVASADRRGRMLERVLRNPWLGAVLHRMYLARLYRTMGVLASGGIALPRAVQMAAEQMPQALRHAVLSALDEIRSGERTSVAFERQGLTTPVALQLLRVGEQGGDLCELLLKAAQFHEDETSRTIERFMRALEPTIMTVLGVSIGAIVIVMYLPIFELASAIR